LGEHILNKNTLQDLEAKHLVPQVSLSNELDDSVRVLSTYMSTEELRLIVSESSSLVVGMLVTLIHKERKGGIEKYFGLGVVRYIQSDEKVQIAINYIQELRSSILN
jgi:hypothetical protein